MIEHKLDIRALRDKRGGQRELTGEHAEIERQPMLSQ